MRILDHDKFSGVTTFFEHDELQNISTLYREQDVEPMLEKAQGMRNDPDIWKAGVKNDFVHYASIPVTVLEEWMKQGLNINDTKELFRMVNKPEYARLKVTDKRHW